MIKRYSFYILLGFIFFTWMVGCTRTTTPDGLPSLVPCKITLTQNGEPACKVEVYLRNKDTSSAWSTVGRTDSSGTATMFSLGKYEGIPKGTYKVVLKKTEVDDPVAYQEAIDAIMSGKNPQKDHFKIYSTIDLKYGETETSPLEVEVDKKTKVSFELGEPVQIEVGKLTRMDL